MTECFHIWDLANGGKAFFRWKTCYPKKSTADAAVRRWKAHPPQWAAEEYRYGAPLHRPAPSLGVYMVRRCDGPPACLCQCHATPQVATDRRIA